MAVFWMAKLSKSVGWNIYKLNIFKVAWLFLCCIPGIKILLYSSWERFCSFIFATDCILDLLYLVGNFVLLTVVLQAIRRFKLWVEWFASHYK